MRHLQGCVCKPKYRFEHATHPSRGVMHGCLQGNMPLFCTPVPYSVLLTCYTRSLHRRDRLMALAQLALCITCHVEAFLTPDVRCVTCVGVRNIQYYTETGGTGSDFPRALLSHSVMLPVLDQRCDISCVAP